MIKAWREEVSYLISPFDPIGILTEG